MNIRNLTGTALCIALGLVLPTLFHIIGAGNVFLPMHIPVFLCGFIFGPFCGFICGLVTPILSSILTGMPPLFPMGYIMTLELGTYGLMSGYFYLKKHYNVYLSLILAMLIGRVVSGIVSAILYGMNGSPYSFSAFLSSSFITSLPGILIQLIFIPLIVIGVKRVLNYRRAE